MKTCRLQCCGTVGSGFHGRLHRSLHSRSRLYPEFSRGPSSVRTLPIAAADVRLFPEIVARVVEKLLFLTPLSACVSPRLNWRPWPTLVGVQPLPGYRLSLDAGIQDSSRSNAPIVNLSALGRVAQPPGQRGGNHRNIDICSCGYLPLQNAHFSGWGIVPKMPDPAHR